MKAWNAVPVIFYPLRRKFNVSGSAMIAMVGMTGTEVDSGITVIDATTQHHSRIFEWDDRIIRFNPA